MTQLTVKELYRQLEAVIKEGHGDKFIIIADDNEGNSYHGMFYGITSDPIEVRDNIDCSNGVYDCLVKNPNKVVILG